MQFLPLFDVQEVQNYPYGFKLRTTLYIHIEYKKWKGFRVGRTTINPKNGKRNATKYSTYHEFARLYVDDKTWYIESYCTDLRDLKSYEKALSVGLFEWITKEVFDYKEAMAKTLYVSIKWMTTFSGWTINWTLDESTKVIPPSLLDSEKEAISIMSKNKYLDFDILLPIHTRIEQLYNVK